MSCRMKRVARKLRCVRVSLPEGVAHEGGWGGSGGGVGLRTLGVCVASTVLIPYAGVMLSRVMSVTCRLRCFWVSLLEGAPGRWGGWSGVGGGAVQVRTYVQYRSVCGVGFLYFADCGINISCDSVMFRGPWWRVGGASPLEGCGS